MIKHLPPNSDEMDSDTDTGNPYGPYTVKDGAERIYAEQPISGLGKNLRPWFFPFRVPLPLSLFFSGGA